MSFFSKAGRAWRPDGYRAARHTGLAVWRVVCVLIVCLAFMVVCARVGLPLLEGQKARLETLLSDQLRTPVSIGQLSLAWQGPGPRLRAEQVLVGEPGETATPLAVEEVRIDVDFFATLWAQVPRVRELSLVGVDLVIDHAPGQSPRLRGLGLGTVADDAAASVDPLGSLLASSSLGRLKRILGNARLALLDTRITLADASTGTRVQIDPVDIRAGRQSGGFRVRADLQFPGTPQSHLSVDVDFDGPVGDDGRRPPDGFGANVLVDIDAMELHDWYPLVAPYLASQPAAGRLLGRLDAAADAELWGRWETGGLQSLRGHLKVRDLSDTQGQVALPGQLGATLDFQPTGHGWQLGVEELRIDSREHQSHVESLVLERRGGDEARWQLDARGESLALSDVASLAALAPGSMQAWLVEARPAGFLQGWQSSMLFEGGAPQISLSGQLQGLRAAAAGGAPAFDGLEGAVAIDQNVGDITLRGRGLQLSHGQFDTPFTPDVLIAALAVDFSRAESTWLQGDVVLNDRGLQTRSRLEISVPGGDSPHVDLQTQFSLESIEQSAEYLPVGSLPPSAASWLKRALRGGRASNGELLLFGRLADFPFDAGEGVFKVGFDLEEGELAFLPGWPSATAIDGRVEFDGTALLGTASAGRLGSVDVSRAVARIEDLRKATLTFNGTGSGELQAMIDFGNEGPLARWLRPALVDVKASGKAEMDIALQVPLRGAGARERRAGSDAPDVADDLSVRGALFLSGNTVRFEGADIELSDAHGAVNFDTRGVYLSNLKTRYLDQPVLLSGTTEGEGTARATVLSATGVLDAKSVLERYELPLTRFIDGKSKWTVSLHVPNDGVVVQRDGVQLEMSSDLVGTRLILPAPLNKSSAAGARFSLSAALHEGQDAILWRLGLAEDVRMQILASTRGEGLRSMAVQFASSPGALPAASLVPAEMSEGIEVNGTVAEFGFDGWIESISALIEDLPAGGEPAPILPITLDLQVESLLAGITPMGPAQLSADTDAGYLHAAIDNQALRASIEYPREYWRRDLVLQSRVAFADMRFFEALAVDPDVAGADDVSADGLDPRLLPAIEARVASFHWDQLDLQDVSLRTSPVDDGLLIDSLGFAYRNTQLRGTGFWRVTELPADAADNAPAQVSGVDLSLISDDLGSDLSRLGYAGLLDEGQGSITAALDWQGAAYLPDLASLSGDVTIDLAAGRILGVNPGAARVVGLFALQALPRRLNLDFKDIVRDGLDFDTLSGDVRLDRGVAQTDLLQFNGPVGVIDVTGSANIVDETYAQRVTILPRVSAALPVIGLISAGASGGIGALVAGGFLKAIGIDFDRLGLREYRLEGTWDEPIFTSVGFGGSSNGE